MVRNGFGVRRRSLSRRPRAARPVVDLPGRERGAVPWEPLSVVGGAAPGADAVSAMLIRTASTSTTDLPTAPSRAPRPGGHAGAAGCVRRRPHSSGGLVLGPEHAQLLGAPVRRPMCSSALRACRADRADMIAAGRRARRVGIRRAVRDDAVGRAIRSWSRRGERGMSMSSARSAGRPGPPFGAVAWKVAWKGADHPAEKPEKPESRRNGALTWRSHSTQGRARHRRRANIGSAWRWRCRGTARRLPVMT